MEAPSMFEDVQTVSDVLAKLREFTEANDRLLAEYGPEESETWREVIAAYSAAYALAAALIEQVS